MGAEPIVQIRNLTKVYQQGEIRVVALHNISLDIYGSSSRF
jgi:ABC-type dipeptide/oligopeptide/nickel transport system ATPase subunit